MKSKIFTKKQRMEVPSAQPLDLKDGSKDEAFQKICLEVCKEYGVSAPVIMKLSSDTPETHFHVVDNKLVILAATTAMIDSPLSQIKEAVAKEVLNFDPDYHGKMLQEWEKNGVAWAPRPEIAKEKELIKALKEAHQRLAEAGHVVEMPKLAIYPALYKNAMVYPYKDKEGIALIKITTGMLTEPYEHLVSILGHEMGHGWDKEIKLSKETMQNTADIATIAAGAVAGSVIGVGVNEIWPAPAAEVRGIGADSITKNHLLSHISLIPIHHLGSGYVAVAAGSLGALATYIPTSSRISRLVTALDERRNWSQELWSDRMGAKAAGKEAAIGGMKRIKQSSSATEAEIAAIYPAGTIPQPQPVVSEMKYPDAAFFGENNPLSHPPHDIRIKFQQRPIRAMLSATRDLSKKPQKEDSEKTR